MKIGILGSGDVAQALGSGFVKHGHDVMIGSRKPDSDKLKGWKQAVGSHGHTGTSQEAAKYGEMVVIATLGKGTEAAVNAAGLPNFTGKVVIDVTNPLDFSGGSAGLFMGTTDSLGERIQRMLPDAKVVKAFNTVSSIQMIDPRSKGGKPLMMIAGNDDGAKKAVEEFVRGVGWGGVLDCGGMDGARWLEAHMPLWVRIGRKLGTWEHIFQPALP